MLVGDIEHVLKNEIYNVNRPSIFRLERKAHVSLSFQRCHMANPAYKEQACLYFEKNQQTIDNVNVFVYRNVRDNGSAVENNLYSSLTCRKKRVLFFVSKQPESVFKFHIRPFI